VPGVGGGDGEGEGDGEGDGDGDGDLDGDDDRCGASDRDVLGVLGVLVGPSVVDAGPRGASGADVGLPLGEDRAPAGSGDELDVPKLPPPRETVEA
jgi:hypothetical protein